MERHANAMENARLQSEGTIESLRLKLNTLQEVLYFFRFMTVKFQELKSLQNLS